MRGVWRLAGLCAAGWLLCGNGCGPGLEPPGGRAASIPSTDGRMTVTPARPAQSADAGVGVNNPTGAAGGGFSATAGSAAAATAGRGGSSAEVDAGVDDAGTP